MNKKWTVQALAGGKVIEEFSTPVKFINEHRIDVIERLFQRFFSSLRENPERDKLDDIVTKWIE